MNPNPFDQDGVIRILLEEADISTLKTLRELNTNWNSLDLKELENRALEDKIKQINFSWLSEPDDKHFLKDAEKEFANFLKSTLDIPQLFRGFRFKLTKVHFHESFKIIPPFFSKFPPIFIHLDMNPSRVSSSFEIFEKNIYNFLASVSRTLKELNYTQLITSIFSIKTFEGVPNLPEILEVRLIFPELNTFSSQIEWGRVSHSSLGVILTPESAPKLTMLEINQIDYDFGEVLQIDPLSSIDLSKWSKLTHLTLQDHCMPFDHVIKTTQVLHSLGQIGMTLKHLHLKFPYSQHASNLGPICENLSKFFQTQAKCLQYLNLFLDFDTIQNVTQEVVGELFIKIKFPVFEELLHLTLGPICATIHGEIIQLWDEMKSEPIDFFLTFPLKFPKLKKLELSDSPFVLNQLRLGMRQAHRLINLM